MHTLLHHHHLLVMMFYYNIIIWVFIIIVSSSTGWWSTFLSSSHYICRLLQALIVLGVPISEILCAQVCATLMNRASLYPWNGQQIYRSSIYDTICALCIEGTNECCCLGHMYLVQYLSPLMESLLPQSSVLEDHATAPPPPRSDTINAKGHGRYQGC